MRKNKWILLVGLFITQISFAQKYISTNSSTSFYSEAPVENIEALSTMGKSILDLGSGDIVFSIAISSFTFDKSLMQEHFNEKYMESDKYPKAIFKGKISGFDLNKEGVQKVQSSGELTIHGITKEINQQGEMTVHNGVITLNHSFAVAIKDYKIKVPKLLWQNIAEVIDIKLTFDYKPYEK
jgi:hypothetical protein